MRYTKPQVQAIKEIIRRIKAEGPDAHTAIGEGSDPLIRRTTAATLAELGLVTLHSKAVSRPARAGYGRPPNWKTVWTPNRWMVATPLFLQEMEKANRK